MLPVCQWTTTIDHTLRGGILPRNVPQETKVNYDKRLRFLSRNTAQRHGVHALHLRFKAYMIVPPRVYTERLLVQEVFTFCFLCSVAFYSGSLTRHLCATGRYLCIQLLECFLNVASVARESGVSIQKMTASFRRRIVLGVILGIQ